MCCRFGAGHGGITALPLPDYTVVSAVSVDINESGVAVGIAVTGPWNRRHD